MVIRYRVRKPKILIMIFSISVCWLRRSISKATLAETESAVTFVADNRIFARIFVVCVIIIF